ncbi:MAG: asparagine synthase (glutamine-hydrolyzing), partial [Bacteroidota bacterium]
HTRLSIIDTSAAGHQPMTDPKGRFTIVFNGEFFNFNVHREQLLQRGIHLTSESDTEVLLHWYILEKEKCLHRINGFFSFAVYDSVERTIFIARDRFGVKPLLFYSDRDNILFASEMKTLIALGIQRELDHESLYTYLQLNYIPGPASIFKGVAKLEPGHYIRITGIDDQPRIEKCKYYQVEDRSIDLQTQNYQATSAELAVLLDAAVQRRLVADVPVGAFLSGGIDSSIIVGLASRHKKGLKTFSFGFRDEPMFDETRYAEQLAKMHGTDHTAFRLTNNDLFDALFDALDYLDEPFADSSALNVFLLSKETRKKVTVALSGDGADEIFGGYNKHEAEWRVRNQPFTNSLIRLGSPLWTRLPKSRNGRFGNMIRQLDRYSKGAMLTDTERYWRWASLADEEEALALMNTTFSKQKYLDRKAESTKHIKGGTSMNDLFMNDLSLVLPNDMLHKVDMMSMANSLEVRSPFMDYSVIEYAFRMPSAYKIEGRSRKRILRDTFRALLPDGLLNRKKQGFEVPLLKWFRNELRRLIEEDLLEPDYIRDQGLFNFRAIENLKIRLHSNDPGDSASRIWGLIVFQYWYKKHFKN